MIARMNLRDIDLSPPKRLAHVPLIMDVVRRMRVLHFAHSFIPQYGGTTTRLMNLLSDPAHQHLLGVPMPHGTIATDGPIANEEGFDLVVRGEMVLYGNNAVDLTGRVTEELDKRREELRAIIIPSAEESGNSEKSSEDSDASQEESKEREPLPLVP